MGNLNIQLLKRVCEAAGAPGFEQRIRKIIQEEIRSLVDDAWTDNLGNLIALKKGTNNPEGYKVMVAAHMDEIGFIVTHIDDNGFVRFHPLGGFDPKTLVAQRVIVHGRKDLLGVMSSKPVHVMSAEERTKAPQLTDFFIDLGMSKKEVERLVKPGDPITRERELVEIGECVNCKSLDNRASVFVLIEALRQINSLPYDLYAVFTVQEEVGLRGASVATHALAPDFGIALDVTVAYDLPGSKPHEQITSLGQGAAIKIMDQSVICDYRMVDYLQKTAEKHAIKWQTEILTGGGTDTASLQRMGKRGSIAGAISIPTRHLHQVIEMAHKEDLQQCITLLVRALEEIDTFNWEHA
ncbi:endoglucanase [Catalinimonas alkaloidigena]|uniref:Endoglucanase n=1 Tax=Catalinimonas alkaloidigena TaxID=1075417 RepID=A0A1G8WE93_9BACT|nr:M42 family metallopeptidase [Catalinimonas alkaloidigena]SDJ76561.1 endoglucanase [Catalinimonas alkaloidigena]